MMVEYYNFGRETVLFKLLSELDEESKDDYVDGFDELDDETEHKVELFIQAFLQLVYGKDRGVIGRVTEITDEHVELCVTEL